jgi:segregation and condensation protein A
VSLLASTLEVKMECFEGPLAVLITLVRKNKVSIWDIPISTITDRFLEYVELVSDLQLRIAEDFIEMASLLIFIKSKLLLPAETAETEEDPRDALVDRIIEYEKIRSMAGTLDGLPMLYRDTFVREQRSVEGEEDYNLHTLCEVFFELIQNREERFILIREIKPTLEERLEALTKILDASGYYVWNVKDDQAQSEKVATILSILELAKLRTAVISQRRPFGKIVVKRREAVN